MKPALEFFDVPPLDSNYSFLTSFHHSFFPSYIQASFVLLRSYDIRLFCAAAVCQDLLLQQEDYARHVRGLLREIVKSVKHEMQFASLARGLMQEPDMEKYLLLSHAHKRNNRF